MYDHGVEINLIRYGQAKPPLYNLSKVTAPVFSIFGENDWLADPVVQFFSLSNNK